MAYIHNTTFIVERRLIEAFKEWAQKVFIPAARESQLFEAITFARILTEIDPTTVNFAVQMRAHSLEKVEQWHRDTANLLKDDIAARLGAESVLCFATNMEVIE